MKLISVRRWWQRNVGAHELHVYGGLIGLGAGCGLIAGHSLEVFLVVVGGGLFWIGARSRPSE